MCFAIFLNLNEFLKEVEKLFVGAGEAPTRPYNGFPNLFTCPYNGFPNLL